MTPHLVTEPAQLSEQDSSPLEHPIVFWVSDVVESQSVLDLSLQPSLYQLVQVPANLTGMKECIEACPDMVIVDGRFKIEPAIAWCFDLAQSLPDQAPMVLLGVETEAQVLDLIHQGLPLGVQDVVPLDAKPLFHQRFAIALNLSRSRSQTIKLAEQVHRLERLNNLKDEFIGTVVHELRTPITNMKVAGQLVEAQIQRVQQALGEEIQSDSFGKALIYLQTLKQECERETVLINNLLDLQSLESGSYTLDVQSIDLESWLAHLIEPFQHRVQTRQLNLELKIQEFIPPLISSAMSLERVLNELLHNACKYTPPGETIQLLAEMSSPEVLELTVKNTGVEIPLAEQSRVFEKFYRVPSSDRWKQGGTGLGLALVQQLMANLGGKIDLQSGGGETRFILELPLAVKP